MAKHRKPRQSRHISRKAGLVTAATSGVLLLTALAVVESGGLGISPVPPAYAEGAIPRFPQESIAFGDLRLERVADDDNPLPETDGGGVTEEVDSATEEVTNEAEESTENVPDTGEVIETGEVDLPENTEPDLPDPSEVETTEVDLPTEVETTVPDVEIPTSDIELPTTDPVETGTIEVPTTTVSVPDIPVDCN